MNGAFGLKIRSESINPKKWTSARKNLVYLALGRTFARKINLKKE